jgi:hypothetical protein
MIVTTYNGACLMKTLKDRHQLIERAKMAHQKIINEALDQEKLNASNALSKQIKTLLAKVPNSAVTMRKALNDAVMALQANISQKNPGFLQKLKFWGDNGDPIALSKSLLQELSVGFKQINQLLNDVLPEGSSFDKDLNIKINDKNLNAGDLTLSGFLSDIKAYSDNPGIYDNFKKNATQAFTPKDGKLPYVGKGVNKLIDELCDNTKIRDTVNFFKLLSQTAADAQQVANPASTEKPAANTATKQPEKAAGTETQKQAVGDIEKNVADITKRWRLKKEEISTLSGMFGDDLPNIMQTLDNHGYAIKTSREALAKKQVEKPAEKPIVAPTRPRPTA